MQTMFFTVKEDISPLIKSWEEVLDIYYYKIAILDEPIVQKFDSYLDVPNFGTAAAGDWNSLDRYLMMKKATTLNVRPVPQRRGGIKYFVDTLLNPVSVAIKLGGVYKDQVIVAGTVGTVAQDDVSLGIYKTVASKIRKEFKLVDRFYVSKTAEKYLKEGWRLVTNEKLPIGFDHKM